MGTQIPMGRPHVRVTVKLYEDHVVKGWNPVWHDCTPAQTAAFPGPILLIMKSIRSTGNGSQHSVVTYRSNFRPSSMACRSASAIASSSPAKHRSIASCRCARAKDCSKHMHQQRAETHRYQSFGFRATRTAKKCEQILAAANGSWYLTESSPSSPAGPAGQQNCVVLGPRGGGGGGLQPVLMQHPPPSYVKTWGGGGGGLGGRLGGGGSQGGGAYTRPTTTTCIPPRAMCVRGFGGTEVCM